MDSTMVLDGVREALTLSLLLGGPLLVVALVAGLFVGVFQTMTQVQEPTVSLVARLVAVAVVVFVGLPWLMSTWLHYAEALWASIPAWIG